MTYDLRVRKRSSDFSTAAQDLAYVLKLKSPAPVEKLIRLAQLTDKGCHTVNSMRKRVRVTGKLLLDEEELVIGDEGHSSSSSGSNRSSGSSRQTDFRSHVNSSRFRSGVS